MPLRTIPPGKRTQQISLQASVSILTAVRVFREIDTPEEPAPTTSRFGRAAQAVEPAHTNAAPPEQKPDSGYRNPHLREAICPWRSPKDGISRSCGRSAPARTAIPPEKSLPCISVSTVSSPCWIENLAAADIDWLPILPIQQLVNPAYVGTGLSWFTGIIKKGTDPLNQPEKFMQELSGVVRKALDRQPADPASPFRFSWVQSAPEKPSGKTPGGVCTKAWKKRPRGIRLTGSGSGWYTVLEPFCATAALRTNLGPGQGHPRPGRSGRRIRHGAGGYAPHCP